MRWPNLRPLSKKRRFDEGKVYFWTGQGWATSGSLPPGLLTFSLSFPLSTFLNGLHREYAGSQQRVLGTHWGVLAEALLPFSVDIFCNERELVLRGEKFIFGGGKVELFSHCSFTHTIYGLQECLWA